MTQDPLYGLDRRSFTTMLLALAGATALPPDLLAKSITQKGSLKPESGPLARAQSKFAFDLIRAAGAKDGKATTVCSPASAGAALALIDLGADDRLKASIYQVLGLPKATAQRDIQFLARETASAADKGPLITANALMIDPAISPKKDLRQHVEKSGAQFFDNLSFGKPETVAAVNAWVAKHTKDHITKLFDSLPAETGLVALNALYFKDRWKMPFNAAKTAAAPFRLPSGENVEAKFMHSEAGYYLFRSDDRFIAASLPFATPDYALTLVTTKGDPVSAHDFGPASVWLSGEGFAASQGQVSIPRLSLSASNDLKPALNALGLEDEGLSGFSDQPLQIAAAQQRVEFTVDEEGAEAAVATGITASRSAASNFTAFLADRPFLFALRNVKTGLILAAGYVAQP
jgi:serpin B